jgi:hypothetical protein
LRLPKVQLLVATNEVTPNETTVKHIEEIWSLLKQISDRHFSDRADELKNVKMDVQSPEVKFKDDEPKDVLCNKLFRLVYQYGYLKFRARHDKYWKVLEKFAKAWRGFPKEDYAKLNEEDQLLLSNLALFFSRLSGISSDIDTYHGNNWNVDDSEMSSEFTPSLLHTLADATNILDDLTGCERLTDIINLNREF